MSDERGDFALRDVLLGAACRAGEMDFILMVLGGYTLCSD
jgi:hypothetical protein